MFGIMYLSAVLKGQRFDTDVFIASVEGELLAEKILNYNPDIVACSVMTPGYKKMIKKITCIKEKNPNIFVIIGGPLPTFSPEIIEEENCIDAVCIGEGEYPLLELCMAFENKNFDYNIKNLWFRKGQRIVKNPNRPFIQDLDSLPFPDRDIYFHRYPELLGGTFAFMTSRGCMYNCTYCFNKYMHKLQDGKWVRQRKNEKVIEEIKRIREKYPIKWISFHDDMLNIDKNKFRDFMTVYGKEVKIPFLCQLRLDHIDEEQIELLKRAGVDRISLGIEHGNEEFRNKYLNRRYSNNKVIEVCKWIKERKIRFHTTNIVGFPEENIDLTFETIELNTIIKPEVAHFFVLIPYPGTKIYTYAKEHGKLLDNFSFYELTGHHGGYGSPKVKSHIRNNDIEKMINLRCFAMILIYHSWLKWIVKILIKFPNNWFYEFLNKVTGDFKVSWKYGSCKERITIIKKLF